jgi:putative endonuclease
MFVYILQSATTGRYYTGSARDLPVRFHQHSQPAENPSRWTRSGGPWELVFSKEFSSVSAAIRAEKFIKRMKSRAFVEKLIRGERNLAAFEESSDSE